MPTDRSGDEVIVEAVTVFDEETEEPIVSYEAVNDGELSVDSISAFLKAYIEHTYEEYRTPWFIFDVAAEIRQ